MSARREEIIDVAKAIFAEQGVKQTTVRQIGATAGILSGSLYHHFTSKDDIVDAILREFCDEGLAGYRRIVADGGDCMAILARMTTFAFRQVAANAAAIVILLNDSRELVSQERFAYLVDYNDEIESHWVRTVQAGIAAGAVRADLDVALFYRFARGAIVSAIRWYDPAGPHTIDEIADACFAVLSGGIGPLSGPAGAARGGVPARARR